MNNCDLKILKKQIGKLKTIPSKRLSDAACDIIDLKGIGLAVLLKKLPEFSPARQQIIAQKIEDFFYFHPKSGRKIFARMQKTCSLVSIQCKAQLLSVLVDIAKASRKNLASLEKMVPIAIEILQSETDFTRKGKAVEILNFAGKKESLLLIIKNMIIAAEKISEFVNYQFFENCLLAAKRIGGESILKLLINPNSDNAIKFFKLEWRGENQKLINELLKTMRDVEEDFPQIVLKVIDLSDFNMPFASIIQEGLTHPDKWVRQSAAVSMEKVGSSLDSEVLSRMLSDPSSEVRMMAVSSLGGYPIGQTGEILEAIVRHPGETFGTKLNALYALFSQKNLEALNALTQEPDAKTALHALGLAALLKPRAEGIKMLLKTLAEVKTERCKELFQYLLELAEPEDANSLIEAHRSASSSSEKENLLELISMFLEKNAGPRLEKTISTMPDGLKKALQLLNQKKPTLQ